MLTDFLKLLETLEKIEALHAGATTPGERHAAASARDRIMDRLRQFERIDEPVEQRFSLVNRWTKQLFCALARRYGLSPYRYHRQRHTTVMLRCPRKFVIEVLWPEFLELNQTLEKYLNEVTDKLIAESIFQGSTEVEIRDQILLEGESDSSGFESDGELAPPEKPPLADRQTNRERRERNRERTPAAASTISTAQESPRQSGDPCPCGSGKPYKLCCRKKKKKKKRR